jgi:hypothetical protein
MSSNIVIASGSPGPVALALGGITLPVVVTGPSGTVSVTAQFKTKAMMDTGSTVSSVDIAILQQVGAQQVGQVTISTVEGSAVAPVYNAGIGMQLASGAVLPLMVGLPGELGDSLPGSTRVLIGDDIMSKLILERNGPAGTWSVSVPATTPMPYLPPGSQNNMALWLGIGGITVAVGSAAALLLVSRNERREIGNLRRELTQAELRAAMRGGR